VTRRAGGAAFLLVVALLVFAAGIATGARAATVDYLHVAANEGHSAGGHAAVRIGRNVYHYQHRAPGLLVAVRHDDLDFAWRYGVLQNRTVRVAHLTVSDEVRERLRAGFNRRHLRQRRHLEAGAALRRDAALFADWRRGLAPGERVCVRGAGLFGDAGRRGPSGERAAPALRELARHLTRRHGTGYLQDRLRDGEHALETLAASVAAVPTAGAHDLPDVGYRFADAHHDLTARLVALRVLADARPVRADVLRRLGPTTPPLGSGEIAWLRRLRARLLHDLARLPDSSRPDWGFPLLLGMARLQAIDASLAGGHLVVLDAFGPEAQVAPDADPPGFARELAEAASNRLTAVRVALADAAADGSAYARLEHAANRHLEQTRALASGAPVRVAEDPLLPAACARVAGLPEPRAARGTLPALHDAAVDLADHWAEALRERYGYQLTEANCVTEIFATIESTLGADEAAELTGTRGALAFIPFVSFDSLVRGAAHAAVDTIPSYRLRRLRAMQSDAPAWLVHLRESSTLTSTLYRRNADDPVFLFFTDDAVLPRPLYGVANLAAGLAQTAAGVVWAPLDGGRMVRLGLRGAGFSLPELAFVNIRKGRMTHVPDVPVTTPARTTAARPPARSLPPRSGAGSPVAGAPASR
jgi:hypothetical protein